MRQYQELIHDILLNGVDRPDRTGTGRRSVFARTMQFDLNDAFPIVTVKRVPFKAVMAELCGFLRGCTSAEQFRELGCYVWDDNANNDGIMPNMWLRSPYRQGEDDLGRTYGHQWRRASIATDSKTGETGLLGDADPVHYDQIAGLIHGLVVDPYSTRHLVVSYVPSEVAFGLTALPPCHYAVQFYVEVDMFGGYHLHSLVNMRSCDVFLGLPFNISSYAALTHIVAHMVDRERVRCGLLKYGIRPGRLTMVLGDAHIYQDHIPQAREASSRRSLWCSGGGSYPEFIIRENNFTIDNVHPDHFELSGYSSHPPISARMAI